MLAPDMGWLVLRPPDQAAATAARLADLGHTAIVSPILAIGPTGDGRPAGRFAAILATSRNARPYLAQPDGTAPLFVVGARTAEILRDAGRIVAGHARDAALLAGLVADRLAPGRVLLVAGQDRAPEPEATLMARGFDVVVWTPYRAVVTAALPEAAAAALRRNGVDGILHYSPRSAAASAALACRAGLAAEFTAVRHLCLSPAVAAALDGVPTTRISVAARPDETALLACLGAPAGVARARAAPDQDAMHGTKSPACACRTANG